MLDESDTDWIILLDGDEVWWDESIKNVTKIIKNKGRQIDIVVNRFVNLIGDIYHYQDDSAGQYELLGIKGHVTFRAMNAKIPGLKIINPHGKQAYVDKKGKLLQDRKEGNAVFYDGLGFMHFTNLLRSSSRALDKSVNKRSFKYKYEIGKKFPKDYYYPESFFRSRPDFIESPWEVMNKKYQARAMIQTPLKKLKRSISALDKKGY